MKKANAKAKPKSQPANKPVPEVRKFVQTLKLKRVKNPISFPFQPESKTDKDVEALQLQVMALKLEVHYLMEEGFPKTWETITNHSKLLSAIVKYPEETKTLVDFLDKANETIQKPQAVVG